MKGWGVDEWQQVGKADGPPGPPAGPSGEAGSQVQKQPPIPASALWGETGESADAAATWGEEVKWWKFNQPDESLSVHVKQESGGGGGGAQENFSPHFLLHRLDSDFTGGSDPALDPSRNITSHTYIFSFLIIGCFVSRMAAACLD